MATVQCPSCSDEYDDAERSTICPHGLIKSAEDRTRHDAAFALVEKDIRFADQPSGPIYRVQAIGHDGMIWLNCMAGKFKPDQFVVIQPPAPAPEPQPTPPTKTSAYPANEREQAVFNAGYSAGYEEGQNFMLFAIAKGHAWATEKLASVKSEMED